MVQRYQAQGGMFRSATGSYVEFSDYEKMEGAIAHVLQTATTAVKQVEAGEITAQDALAALEACATLARA